MIKILDKAVQDWKRQQTGYLLKSNILFIFFPQNRIKIGEDQ